MKHVNMYRHVCTMFSNVHTVLLILVQVITGRIPDDLLMMISAWIEAHGYLTVNSEKTMFMKQEGKEWIMHGLGLFVDDMAHA